MNFQSSRSDSSNSTSQGKRRIQPIGSLVSQLMSRRGYAQSLANDAIHEQVASILDSHLKTAFQVGNLRAGVLQIYATDSVTLQELNFRKRAILKHLQKSLPDSRVKDLRFRIQSPVTGS